MTDLEKIQELIESKTKENNAIALHLMMSVVGWTFEQAFLQLKINHDFYFPHYFAVETPTFSLNYSNGYIIDIEGWYCQILNNDKIIKEIELLNVEYTFPEGSHLSAYYKNKTLGDFELLQNDLQIMLPKIKELYFETN